MAKLLSVIVPIYNTESYLHRMVESIINQGLDSQKYEILLINDGSTDNSLQVCEELAGEYPSIIKVYTQPNSGVGRTRNRGVDLAEGVFVYFMDSDDYLLPDRMGKLLKRVNLDNVDVIQFSSVTVDRYYRGDEYYLSQPPKFNLLYGGTCEDRIKSAQIGSFVWNLFIRKEFILRNGIKYTDCPIGEDGLYNLELMLKRPRLAQYDTDIYRYCIRETSAIAIANDAKLRRHIASYLAVFTRMTELAENESTECAAGVRTLISRQCTPFLSRVLRSDLSRKEFKQLLSRLEEINCRFDAGGSSRPVQVFNFIAAHTWAFPVLRLFYRHIFFPYIHPRLRRN